MNNIEISQEQIEALQKGQDVSLEREGSQNLHVSNADKSPDDSADMYVDMSSLDALESGEHLEYVRSQRRLIPPGWDESQLQEDNNTSQSNNRSRRTTNAPDDRTLIEIDTSMLRQLATGTVTINIELTEEEWDELAGGGSAEVGEDYYLTYEK